MFVYCLVHTRKVISTLVKQVCPQALWARKLKVSGRVSAPSKKDGFDEFVLWDTHEHLKDRNGRVQGPGHILLNTATRELEITEHGHMKIFETLGTPTQPLVLSRPTTLVTARFKAEIYRG